MHRDIGLHACIYKLTLYPKVLISVTLAATPHGPLVLGLPSLHNLTLLLPPFGHLLLQREELPPLLLLPS